MIGLMEVKIKFEEYPKFLKEELLNEMLLLNSSMFDDGSLFDNSITNIISLEKHIMSGYNPNEYFECWTDKEHKEFCLIPKVN